PTTATAATTAVRRRTRSDAVKRMGISLHCRRPHGGEAGRNQRRNGLLCQEKLTRRLRGRRANRAAAAMPITNDGSGTTAPSAGEGRARLKFCASALKSSELVRLSKLKSASVQILLVPPKLLARKLKSSAFTTPSRFASPI